MAATTRREPRPAISAGSRPPSPACPESASPPSAAATGPWTASASGFLSSRRRHTRYWRDWSSDVCSSDLIRKVAEPFGLEANLVNVLSECKKAVVVSVPTRMDDGSVEVFQGYRVTHNVARGPSRSEERRVGQACRSRWPPYH